MIKTSSSADWLDLNQTAELEDLARQQGWIGADERVVAITKPGEGNMNFVVRIVTDCSSFIVKQARPWVEKYPQIAAPTERILAEMSFYQLVHQRPLLSGFFPQLVHTLVDQHILVLEDLGVNADFPFIYTQPDRLRRADILQLTGLLSRLHQAVFSSGQIKAYPQNMALRRLNYEHFYVFPFLRVNGLKLDGVVRIEQEGDLRRFFNSMAAISGKGEVLAVYDKAHLVPFGEYLPLYQLLEPLGITKLTGGSGRYTPGTACGRFLFRGRQASVR